MNLQQNTVIPAAQQVFAENLNLLANDILYGTCTAPVGFWDLVKQYVLLVAADNSCGLATAAQLNCFLSQLNQTCNGM